jgi:hypothetical protein
MQAGTKIRRSPKTPANKNPNAPTQLATDAPFADVHPIRRVNKTANGLNNNPKGPPITNNAFAVAPVRKCCTAMISKNVDAAVSKTPAVTARRSSN